VRVAFEVMVFICIGVCYPKQSLNCNTIASHSPNEWDANDKCWNNLKVVFSNYSNIKVEEEYSPVSGGAYCRIDAAALFPDGTGVGELTFLASSRGDFFQSAGSFNFGAKL
jgi:hypothetical protein